MRGEAFRAAGFARLVRMACLVAASLLLVSCLSSAQGQQPPEPESEEPGRPNVILILTDDLAYGDLSPAMLENMPNLRSELVEGGTTFENSFVTNSLCCPSRATTLRGQYAHNKCVENRRPKGSCGVYFGAERRDLRRIFTDGSRVLHTAGLH